MYSFKNDYSEGAHPHILNALIKCNLEQSNGYGLDTYSLQAAQLIRKHLANEQAAIHFIAGGTQTNMLALSSWLRPHEAAVAAVSGHIFVHETGAVEATGHKVLTIDTADGKIKPNQIQKVLEQHTDEHMVKPKLVYISQPTEVGTIYSKAELTALSEFCRTRELYFYVDGARLASALTARSNDVTLRDLAALTDAFYIGGTKCGALIGEALVICRRNLQTDFRFFIKQRGAMLAKGRLLGIQFAELFTADLYTELGAYANKMARKIETALKARNIAFLFNSPTNQLFPILSTAQIAKLQQKYDFIIWEKIDDESAAIRLVTSWATCEAAVEEFIADLNC